MPALRPLLMLAAAGGLAATAMLGEEPAPKVAPAPVRPEIGASVAPENLHLIKRPGLYGVSEPGPGMAYAVVGSSLVRIDTATKVVRAIIRGGVRPVD